MHWQINPKSILHIRFLFWWMEVEIEWWYLSNIKWNLHFYLKIKCCQKTAGTSTMECIIYSKTNHLETNTATYSNWVEIECEIYLQGNHPSSGNMLNKLLLESGVPDADELCNWNNTNDWSLSLFFQFPQVLVVP